MTRVLLTRPHTHAGKPYAPGERLAVDAASAAWLLAQGLAKPEPKPAKPDSEPKTLKEPTP